MSNWFDQMFQPAGLVTFEHEGVTFHVKTITIEELFRDYSGAMETANDSFVRACKMLANCRVNAQGQQMRTEEQWRALESRHAGRVMELAKKVQSAIGAAGPESTEEQGKESEVTADSASNSTSP